MKRIVFGLLWSSFALATGCAVGVDEAAQTEVVEPSVEGTSEALATPEVRPRICDENSDCARGQYCASKPGLCGLGVCKARPRICTRIYQPVCGCDDQTYGNECEAAGAGVSVASQGACEDDVFCGGIAAFPCPGSGKCVDDPKDDCDPRNGGADCSGICKCPASMPCPRGSTFDPSPQVCSCVPDTGISPCAVVLCPSGTECVVIDGAPSCEPIADPCATVRCRAGYHCVAKGTVAQCVPDAPGAACGSVTCPEGTQCCNASCGWCRPPGVACIQIACN